jgi:ABC-type lipoprotein export system ATPase subunit
MDETYVEMENVGRTYTRGKIAVEALRSVNCEVKSGSGKSTLLHIMGGLDDPTEGKIRWPALGKKIDLRPKKVCFVFQTTSLLPPLTVLYNVRLPLLLARTDPSQSLASALGVLQRMGLESIAEKLPEELSGGQAQRVAFARALSLRPKLILADEPTGQLDHPTAQRLFDMLLESLESTGTALVVATHDVAIADRMDTVWRIEHGRVETVRCSS